MAQARFPWHRRGSHGTGALGGAWGGASSPPHGTGNLAEITPTERLSNPPLKVLYIAGAGRSGSTLLDGVLGQLDGFFAAGELRYLWERGLQESRLCGCGVAVRDCPTWRAVLASAFGPGVDANAAARLQRKATRVRCAPAMILSGRLGRRRSGRLGAVLGPLYQAIQESTGCRVLVDSSKLPSYGALLEALPGVELYVLHLVRDPRATAWSWLRRKRLTDTPAPRLMQRQPPGKSAAMWMVWNLAAALLWSGGPRYLRLRYEDLVRRPEAAVRRIAGLVGESPAALPFPVPGRLALVSLVLALSAFVLASRVGAAPLPAATVSTRPSASAGANGRVTAIARAGDRVYIGGSFTSVGGQPRGGLAALDAGTGRVYAGGKFTSIGGVARPYLAALSTDGAVLGWDPRADASVRALALDGGRLYAAGDFHNIGGRAQRTIAALDPASAADSGWHPQATCPGLGLTVASGTVYLACGGASAGGGNAVLAYSASTGARRWSAGGDGDVHAVAVLDGVAYTGGHFTTIAGASRKKAAAFDAASGQLLAWDPHPDSTLGVFSMLADGDWLWMGGDFTSVGGVAQAHIARLGFDSASTRTQTDVPGPKLGGRGADRFADPRVATLPHPN